MGIRVEYQPSAAVLGGAAFAGGYGQYQRYLDSKAEASKARKAAKHAQDVQNVSEKAARRVALENELGGQGWGLPSTDSSVGGVLEQRVKGKLEGEAQAKAAQQQQQAIQQEEYRFQRGQYANEQAKQADYTRTIETDERRNKQANYKYEQAMDYIDTQEQSGEYTATQADQARADLMGYKPPPPPQPTLQQQIADQVLPYTDPTTGQPVEGVFWVKDPKDGSLKLDDTVAKARAAGLKPEAEAQAKAAEIERKNEEHYTTLKFNKEKHEQDLQFKREIGQQDQIKEMTKTQGDLRKLAVTTLMGTNDKGLPELPTEERIQEFVSRVQAAVQPPKREASIWDVERFRFPDRDPGALIPPVQPQAQPEPTRNQAPVRVNSEAQLRSLPPGTVFIAPDGSRKVKQ